MPQRVASTPSAVATWVLPRPVGPWKTRSSARPTKSSESISSQPQPSGSRTWDQSRPSPALGTGIPACLSSPARFERSRDSSSRASIDEHAENWRGGGVDAAGGPEGADRPLHGRRLPRLDAASRGTRRSARSFAGSSESRKETPVRRRPPHRAVASPHSRPWGAKASPPGPTTAASKEPIAAAASREAVPGPAEYRCSAPPLNEPC